MLKMWKKYVRKLTEQKSESRVLTGAEVAIPRLGYRISATVIDPNIT